MKKHSQNAEPFLFSDSNVIERLKAQEDKPVHHQKIVELPRFRFSEPLIVKSNSALETITESAKSNESIEEIEAKVVQQALKESFRDKLSLPLPDAKTAGNSNDANSTRDPQRILSSRSMNGFARSTALQTARALLSERKSSSEAQLLSSPVSRRNSKQGKIQASGSSTPVSARNILAESLSPLTGASRRSSKDETIPLSHRESYFKPMEVPQYVLDNADEQPLQYNEAEAKSTREDSQPTDEYDVVPESMKDSYRERAPPLRERYFGPDARIRFYDRYRFLSKQHTLTCTDVGDELSAMVFDNEDPEHREYPFSNAGQGGQNQATGESNEEDKKNIMAFKSKYEDEFPDHSADISVPLSPRSRFISGCIRERKNPRASLILRKRLDKSINISHMAIGNDVAMLLAQCLGDMPYIESLNINNNNLTDEGVAAILKAIKPIKTLKYLNISRNKMDDDAADALAEYVKMEDCPCESLIMQVSDVDDFEGEHFVRCLMENRSITEIDLSDNLIGRAENMRTVIADMVTCSEAFAEMLEVENCILKKLTLAWNTIRLSSSIRLTQALRNNSSLTYLDLSYNSLSFDGGEALGDALLENTTLEFLNVSSNSLNASAIFTISTGIIENKALRRVILDNNPIGEAGASALMQVPLTVGARCSLSAEKCNCGLVDPRCWFSHSNPLGRHELDLSQPYQRAVAFALLELVANHATYIFVSAEYEKEGSGVRQDLKLFQTVATDSKEKYFDERQKSIVAGLRKMRDASGNREKGIQLFHEADEDGGGSIDGDELTDLLTSVGMEVTPDMVEDLLDQYDIDGQGAIGLPEFLAFLKNQYKEAVTRLEEMTEERIMATAAAPNKKYQPPRSGKLIFYVMDGFTRKAKFSVISSCDQEYAKTVSSQVAEMLGFAVANSKVRLGEAIQMFNTMYAEGGQKANILAELVVKLADPQDCKKLVMKITHGDKVQINLLKNAMGGAYKPYLGILNGYYQLDLSHKMDQIALTRLLEQSQTDNTRRQGTSPFAPGQVGDTSQCGNWTSFRNEFFNNKRFAVQPDRFRPMPKNGKLQFDYSNVARPVVHEDLIILSDKRLIKILQNIFLVKEDDAPFYLKKLGIWRRHLKIASTGKGHMLEAYQYSKEKGVAIGKACNEFYTRLDDRNKDYSEGFKRENVTVDYQGKKAKKGSKKAAKVGGAQDEESKDELQATASAKSSRAGSRKGSDAIHNMTSNTSPRGEATVVEIADGAMINDEAKLSSATEPEQQNADDNADDIKAAVEGSKEDLKQKLNEELAKYKLLIESPLVSREAKSARINEQLEDLLANAWILCRHVAAIILATPHGVSARTDWFGSYHVDLVVSLFSRIVDIHNFEVIMSVLTAEECAQVYCRIGWLNIFNPTKPEGMYCLDFCRYEERLVAKMLIGLALVEPGDNWRDKCFRWAWDVDEVPGWELTTGYTLDESCTVKGVVQVRYYSGEGKGLGGCVAHVTFRKAMYSLVLASENIASIDFDEMFPYLVRGGESDSEDEEEKRDKLALRAAMEAEEKEETEEEEAQFKEEVKKIWPGEKFMLANPKMWMELFAPPNGCQKQKNPLNLIYTTAIVKDEIPATE